MKKKKSVLRRVIEIVGTVVILGIIALLAFVVVGNIRGDVVFLGNKTVVWVKTNSMEPLIPAQSYILVEKVERGDVAVGDVILFYSDDPSIGHALNTHRVVEIQYTSDGVTPVSFVTRGDNNYKNDDSPARASQVVARYVKNLPALTGLGRFLTKPAGLITTLALLLVMTGAAFAPDFIAAGKEKAEKKKQAEMEELIRAAKEQIKLDGGENQETAPKKPDKSEKEDE